MKLRMLLSWLARFFAAAFSKAVLKYVFCTKPIQVIVLGCPVHPKILCVLCFVSPVTGT